MRATVRALGRHFRVLVAHVTQRLLLAALLAAATTSGCVSPALDGLSAAECANARDCGEGQTCQDGACVPVSTEVCDGVDNNGDGRIDETFDLKTDPANCGVCGKTCDGRCIGGECQGDGGTGADAGCIPSVEVCDGVDNDCDGDVDEGTLNACGQCGPVPVETCNDVDDDCNGQIDDGLPVCGGSCHIPVEAPCNGLDDDCNGTIDDAPEPPGGCGNCVPEEVACDGMDEDCDGTPDDGLLNDCGECGPAPAEICNGLDDNCDGNIDEGIVGTGGACAVGDGGCERTGTIVCTAEAGAGAESPLGCDAIAGSPVAELCGNAVDDDCDLQTDEGFDGQFGIACNVGLGRCAAAGVTVCGPEGTAICNAVAGSPLPESCDGIDNNCDGQTDEGFDLQRDPQNCGVCDHACLLPNATASCVTGNCEVDTCVGGYIDHDNAPLNGCECQPGAADLPDEERLDTNCDGVDGDAAQSIFLSADRGADCIQPPGGGPDPCPGVVPGTPDNPVRTLGRALELATSHGYGAILIDRGLYTSPGAFVLDTSVGLYGGYIFDPATLVWSRDLGGLAPTTIRAGRVRSEPDFFVRAGVSAVFDDLTIEAQAAAEGQSAVGVVGQDCAGIRLQRTQVQVGDGGRGVQARGPGVTVPETASLGEPGSIGNGGRGAVNPSCLDLTQGGDGGLGLAAPSGFLDQEGQLVALPGLTGGGQAPGGDGASIVMALDGAASLVRTDTAAIGGADGDTGGPGTPGRPGSPGGSIDLATGGWRPHGGIIPAPGVNGGGGGGGGAGISDPLNSPDVIGPSGGGGGAGGCGGLAGENGGGGGASIGLVVSGLCRVELFSSSIGVGRGGDGALSAAGTPGGRGRQGGIAESPIRSGPDALLAMSGGRGGDGGCGGIGAGGPGGPSVAILRANGAPFPELDAASALTTDFGGGGGQAAATGCRTASIPAPAGSAGVSISVGCCADPLDCGLDLACAN